jgi:hypothetical protein
VVKIDDVETKLVPTTMIVPIEELDWTETGGRRKTTAISCMMKMTNRTAESIRRLRWS